MKNPIFKKGEIYKSVLKNPGKIVKVLEDSDEETSTFNCVVVYIHNKELGSNDVEGDITWYGKNWFEKMTAIEDTSAIEEFIHDRTYVKTFSVDEVVPSDFLYWKSSNTK
jgi:hypothetical protein